MFDAGPSDADGIDLLKGVGTEQCPRHLTGDADQGHGVEEGIGQGGENIGGSGTGGGKGNSEFVEAGIVCRSGNQYFQDSERHGLS